MRIDPKSTIAGYPSIKIRNLLRRYMFDLTPDDVCNYLKVSLDRARELIARLEQDGLVTQVNKARLPDYWRCSDAGGKLALASASLPIKRSTAERLLSEFMERVKSINDDPGYLYSVSRVAVFGSYLTDNERLNDLDMAVEIERRVSDNNQFGLLVTKRVAQARQNGWRPRNHFEMAYYPQFEIYKILRGGKRAISLHAYSELDELGCAYQILLGG